MPHPYLQFNLMYCTTSRIISSGWGSWQKLNWQKNDVGTTVVGTDWQLPTSNAGAKELGFGTLGGATLVIIKEIIEITDGKQEEEKKEEEFLEKMMTSKK